MAKGSIGKENVIKKIQAAFGADYIGEYDKKYYVWTTENGEKIQIAISMTCPKVPILLDATVQNEDLNFENIVQTTVTSGSNAFSAEITEEEKKNIADLMAKLGL